MQTNIDHNDNDGRASVDAIERAASTLQELVPTSDTLWGGIPYETLEAVTPATLRVIVAMSRQQDQQLQQVVGPVSRAMDKALMVRAVVIKHEASRLDGYLAEEFRAADITIAQNTDPDIAINAGVFRLLSCSAGVATIDKYRVSRAAKAMRGIEIICEEEGLEISFGMAGEILDELATSSRKSLCDLVDQRVALRRATPAEEVAATELDSPQPPSEPARLLISQGGSADDGSSNLHDMDEGEEEADATSDSDQIPMVEPSRPLIAAPPIEPDLFANFAAVGSVVIDQELPEADVHLVALIRDGDGYVIRGPICSGDVAADLIRQAMAG